MKSNEKQFDKMIITNYLKEKVKKVFSSFLIFFVKYLRFKQFHIYYKIDDKSGHKVP